VKINHPPLFNVLSASEAFQVIRSSSARPLSIRQLSRRLGYSSDRAIGMVLQGKRTMSQDMLVRISRWARLTRKESDFVGLLIRRDRILKTNGKDKELDLEIAKYRTSRYRERRVQGSDLEGLAPWFSYVLLELLKFPDQPMSVEALVSRLRGEIAESDVQKSLDDLIQIGIVKLDQNGFYQPVSDDHLCTSVDIPSRKVRDHIRAQLQRAAHVLDEQSVLEREFCLKTFTMSMQHVAKMKKRIREVMQELEAEFLQLQPDANCRVMQLNIEFYQQSK
jgi:uncharacterized protein (TIGR02147 family)